MERRKKVVADECLMVTETKRKAKAPPKKRHPLFGCSRSAKRCSCSNYPRKAPNSETKNDSVKTIVDEPGTRATTGSCSCSAQRCSCSAQRCSCSAQRCSKCGSRKPGSSMDLSETVWTGIVSVMLQFRVAASFEHEHEHEHEYRYTLHPLNRKCLLVSIGFEESEGTRATTGSCSCSAQRCSCSAQRCSKCGSRKPGSSMDLSEPVWTGIVSVMLQFRVAASFEHEHEHEHEHEYRYILHPLNRKAFSFQSVSRKQRVHARQRGRARAQRSGDRAQRSGARSAGAESPAHQWI